MGKTEKGAVWLDAEKTSPYEFYQYWRNVGDQDVIKCMKLLTFIPMEQINEYAKLEGAELNKVKEVLAFELTKMIHGEEEATKAQNAAKALLPAVQITLICLKPYLQMMILPTVQLCFLI